jgi:hypothetical protein
MNCRYHYTVFAIRRSCSSLIGVVPRSLNGKTDGQVTYFYENGSIRGTGFYSSGTLDSIWRDDDEPRTLILERVFKKGNQIN